MKKILVMLISVFFILNGIEVVAFSTNKTDINDYENNRLYSSVLNPDELDQFQTEYDSGFMIGFSRAAAQEFIPQKGILTRVELYIQRYEVYPPVQPFCIAIRNSLNGENLAVTNVVANNIPYIEAWIEFNFEDIPVNPGKTYYLISYTDDQQGFFIWRGIDSNPYPNGIAYSSVNNGETWKNEPDFDLCFKTYGLVNDPPEIPQINGPATGVKGEELQYFFVSTDPDEDNIFYCIDWDDGTGEVCIGPFTSGEEVPVNHSWNEKGRYKIKVKAKDIIGHDSDWKTMVVKIPRNKKANDMLFLRFLERFPIIQKMLNFLTIYN